MPNLELYRDRMTLAFAISIALTLIVLPLLHPLQRAEEREQPARTMVVTIETPAPTPPPTPKPTPTPRPTPPPTPPPRITPPPHVTPAPVPQREGKMKGTPVKHHGGGAHRPTTVHVAHLASASGIGSGTSSGTGSGTTPGEGGGQGGTGTGNAGNGNGSVNAETPCGVVEFVPYDAPSYKNGTAYEPIKAIVTFRDGHKETDLLPYKWVYPDGERNDPWSNTNLANKNFPVLLQTPPPGTDISNHPLLEYIIQHSDAQGFTKLPDCPRGVSS